MVGNAFYAKVRVPLSNAGWVELTVDLDDLPGLSYGERTVVFDVLHRTIDFARGVEEAPPLELAPVAEPEDVPDDQPVCDECGQVCETEGGLRVHLARTHGQLSKPKVCAAEDCETVLSRYNKSKWCAPHERDHPPKHFGKTG